MDPDDKDFAREALNAFSRRRGETHCAACLVERPGSLRVKSGAPCEACKKRRHCIGAPRREPSAPP